MEKNIVMPKLSPQMEAGVLVSLLKAKGDTVAKGEVLFEVETDKVVSEVESTQAGVVAQVLAAEGDSVPVGQTVMVIKAAQ